MMDILATPPTNSAPRLLHLSITAIDIPEAGIRRAAVEPAQDEGLRQSVAALGVIQPIAVRAHPDDPGRRVLITGRRRLAAAIAAGHRTIAVADHGAIEDREALAIETAENLQREPLAPLDQWRAIRRHVEIGWSLEDTANALGIGYALARKLDKLGSLHPDVLAAIEAHGLPGGRSLYDIANAPPEAQAKVLKKHWKNPAHAVPWWQIARDLAEVQIPRGRAIFDADASGLVWVEDYFAEPGSPGQWTTTDLPGFLKAQQAELARQAEASKGKIVVVEADRNGQPKLPPKWTDTWGWRWGEKLPKGATGYVMVKPNGEIAVRAAKPPPAKPKTAPKSQPAKAGDGDSSAADEEPEAEAPTPAKPRWSEKGRILLAERKTDAIRAALRDRQPPSAETLLLVLLLALDGDNVSVLGAEPRLEGRTFGDIAAIGWAVKDLPDAGRRLRRLAAEAAARMLRCGPTASKSAGWVDHSGAAAEWVGRLLDATRAMPPLDDEALLATASKDALAAACHTAGLSAKGTATAMRAALQGRCAHILLFEEAQFRADQPSLDTLDPPEHPDRPCGQAAGAETCEACWWKASDGTESEPCAQAEWTAQLARLGLTPAEIVVEDGTPRLAPRVIEPPPADLAEQRAQDAAAFDGKPAGAFDCAWPGHAICREDGTTRCLQMCPRHEKYVEWQRTPEGQRARRAADNEAARASLKKPRGRKPQQEGTTA